MAVRLVHDNYGKSRVRLLKVARGTPSHDIQNLTVNIALEGEFEAIHREGDNSACLPTDTMKNTVYALAGENDDIDETALKELVRAAVDFNESGGKEK